MPRLILRAAAVFERALVLGVVLGCVCASTPAAAQTPGDLPTLPPSVAPAPAPSNAPAPSDGTQSDAAPVPAAPAAAVPAAPAPYVYEPAPPPTHAPHNAFWIGAQLGAIGYGGSFFINGHNREETSGNFVGGGASLEVDVGARLNRRYMPYVFGEYAALARGHRFDENARASSNLLGLGFRFIIGQVDKAGFLADLSLARRTITIDSGGQTFKMHAPEIFRLALGAELRLSNLLTLSPVMHLSGGSMEQSDGTVLYARPQGDGETSPSFQERSIGPSQRSYLVVGIGCGAHFDLFGK